MIWEISFLKFAEWYRLGWTEMPRTLAMLDDFVSALEVQTHLLAIVQQYFVEFKNYGQ